jgi:hypothetical protein
MCPIRILTTSTAIGTGSGARASQGSSPARRLEPWPKERLGRWKSATCTPADSSNASSLRAVLSPCRCRGITLPSSSRAPTRVNYCATAVGERFSVAAGSQWRQSLRLDGWCANHCLRGRPSHLRRRCENGNNTDRRERDRATRRAINPWSARRVGREPWPRPQHRPCNNAPRVAVPPRISLRAAQWELGY